MPEVTTCPQCGTELPPGAAADQCPKCMLEVGLGSKPDFSTAQADSTRPPAPTPSELARHFPQLEILELLGQGGMGIVYKARQTRLDRLVALKILPAQIASDPSFAERFAREARALARLNHPNIVAVYDFGETNGIYYFLMEYVDGPNLRQIEQSNKLTPREALQIIPSLCDALQYAHNLGIVHRDIKPENVLIDKQGRTKIADFGLAKLLGQSQPGLNLTQERQVMGTLNYMAPEQVERPAEVDHRADIYSLGVVFYEMLTGELPLGRFAPPSQKVEVDVRLDEVVLRALEKERERRYQQASEVKTDLANLSHPATQVMPAPVPAGAAAWVQAHQSVKGPAIGLIIVGILHWLSSPVLFAIAAYMAAGQQTNALPILVAFLPVLTGSFTIFGGFKMKALEARWAALTASILALIVSPANLVGLPIGIWSLVTLTRRQVRSEFGKGPPPATLPAIQPANPRNWFFVTATIVLAGAAIVVAVFIGAATLAITFPALARMKAQQTQALNEQKRALTTILSGSITNRLRNELRNEYNIQNFEINLSDSMDSGVITLTVVLMASNNDHTIVFDLRRDADGSWRVTGREPFPHLQWSIPKESFITPPPATAIKKGD